MDVGIGLVDVADAEFAAGLRHYLHQANRACPADRALVKTRFLIALRHQHEGVEPVFVGIAPEDLDRVTKALHVGASGRRVQLLELQQVGPRIVRPPVHIPGDLGDRAIERCKELRVVRADRPADLGAFSQRRLRVQPQALDDLHPESPATQSSPTVAGNNPAAVISIRSATSSVSGTMVMVTGGLPWAVSRSLSFARLS